MLCRRWRQSAAGQDQRLTAAVSSFWITYLKGNPADSKSKFSEVLWAGLSLALLWGQWRKWQRLPIYPLLQLHTIRHPQITQPLFNGLLWPKGCGCWLSWEVRFSHQLWAPRSSLGIVPCCSSPGGFDIGNALTLWIMAAANSLKCIGVYSCDTFLNRIICEPELVYFYVSLCTYVQVTNALCKGKYSPFSIRLDFQSSGFQLRTRC